MDGYMEDYVAGAVHEYGSIRVTEEEIVDFARRYDPHYFHIDPERAKKTPYGGLIASGWHTAALMMRLLVDNFISAEASLGSPGVDKLRWLKPVRPGDELSIRVTIHGTRRSRTKPGIGYIEFSVEVMNQRRDMVMTMDTVGMGYCREKG